MIHRQSEVRRALDLFSELTVAVLSAGSREPRTSQLIDFLYDGAQQRLEAQGAEGEIAGIFLSRDGEVLSDPMLDRFTRISAGERRAVPQRIISADGGAKAGIVIAAVRPGLADIRIIDMELASRAIEILDAQEADPDD